MKEKLDSYLYGITDKPPFFTVVLLGLQHLIKFSLLLMGPLLIINAANEPPAIALHVVSMSLIAGAIATLLMALRKTIGAGCFIPAQTSVPFFGALLMTAKIGGMPLVFGMTIVMGLLQCLLTPLFRYGKKIFDEQFVGFIILILGVWSAVLGVSELFHPRELGQLLVHTSLIKTGHLLPESSYIGLIALAIIIGMRLLQRGRLYCLLVGLLGGWLLAFVTGTILPKKIKLMTAAPWFAFPQLTPFPHFVFNWYLLFPLLLAAFIASFEAFALITTIENLESNHWQPNLQRARNGNLAAGIGVVISGLLGGIAQSPVPGSIGDLIATGAQSRCIAFVYAPALFLLAFSPKIAMFFLTIPAAVNGAAIVFIGGTMLMKGLEMLHLPICKDYQFHALSFAFIFALSIDTMPQLYLSNYPIFSWITNSDMAVGLIMLVLLRLLFKLGQKP